MSGYTPIGVIREELRAVVLGGHQPSYLDEYNLQGAYYRALIEEHPDHDHGGPCANHLAWDVDPFKTRRKSRPPFRWAGAR